jgi:hypothetical protein
MLSWHIRKSHAKHYGLAEVVVPEPPVEPPVVSGDADIAPSEGTSDFDTNEDNTVGEGFESEGINFVDGLLDWYRESRGLRMTRSRMDGLLQVLRCLNPGLPRQIRTLERQRAKTNPLDFASHNLVRSVVCGRCTLEELITPASECECSLSFISRIEPSMPGEICRVRIFICPRCSVRNGDFEAVGYSINATFFCPKCRASTQDTCHTVVAYTLTLVSSSHLRIYYGTKT